DELLREVTVDPEILQNIRDNIMYADKENAAHLSKIVSEYQILCSRLLFAETHWTFKNEKVRTCTGDVAIYSSLQWVTNFLRIEAAYSYARGRKDEIGLFVLSSRQLSRAFKNQGLTCPEKKQGDLAKEIEAFPITLNKLERALQLYA
ncbi:MAG: hypothetical protein ABF285_06985, partial [Pacificibacter sp.]